MISINGIEKTYGAISVVKDVTFSFSPGEKVALVGPNGVGKSTLMRIIAGEIEPDAGTITIPDNYTVGYLPQEFPAYTDVTIGEIIMKISGMEDIQHTLSSHAEESPQYMDALEKYIEKDGYNTEHKMESLLTGFGVDRSLDTLFSHISLGQKAKVYIVGLLLGRPDLLLLDEPTNNLDIPAIQWLEEFLCRDSNIATLIISHDVELLDAVTSKVVYIDWETRSSIVVNGNYSHLRIMLEQSYEKRVQEYQSTQEEKKRLLSRAKELEQKSRKGSHFKGSDNDKFARGAKRDRAGRSGKKVKALQSQVEKIDTLDKPLSRKDISLNIDPASLRFSISAVDVSAKRGDFILQPFSLNILPNSRIGIIGSNGGGKTTLLSVLKGSIDATEGSLSTNGTIVIADYMQALDSLLIEISALEYLQKSLPNDDRVIYSLLISYGLSQEMVQQPLASLSPGQRARVLYAKFSIENVNVLLFDEPTNHLDIESQQALIEVVNSFEGACVIVSHDRKFLRSINFSEVLKVEKGHVSRIDDIHTYIAMSEEKAKKMVHTISL